MCHECQSKSGLRGKESLGETTLFLLVLENSVVDNDDDGPRWPRKRDRQGVKAFSGTDAFEITFGSDGITNQ